MLSIKTDKNGFTMIEVLIAMVIITIAILSLNGMQIANINATKTAGQVTTASMWNSDLLETFLIMPYDDPDLDGKNDPLEDVDGDGTRHDADKNGEDDQGADFGLNDLEGDADHSSSEVDDMGELVHGDLFDPEMMNLYTVYWNVALDQPVPNAKTIRIHVMRNSDHAVLASFETYKTYY